MSRRYLQATMIVLGAVAALTIVAWVGTLVPAVWLLLAAAVFIVVIAENLE